VRWWNASNIRLVQWIPTLSRGGTSIINRTQSGVTTATTTATVHMPDTTQEGAGCTSTLKRPRDTPESHQSPPLKRSKTNQYPTTTPTSESAVSYDACPMPNVMDYFYEDLMPKAPELSQLFPTLCHDVYVVRRWLGSVGCATHWRMIMEDINKLSNVPNPLAGLIACSLAKLSGPQREASSPKYHTLCETLRSHLGSGDTHRIVVFSEFLWLETSYKLTPDSALSRSCTSCCADAGGTGP
jgi:hypothetical protein